MDDEPKTTVPAARNVAELLESQIIGGLDLGARLPSETELAERFGVSRVTVREALKLLAGQGLVSLSRGRRATVTQPDGAMFGAFLKSLIHSDPRAVFDLSQVRRSLEVQSVTCLLYTSPSPRARTRMCMPSSA